VHDLISGLWALDTGELQIADKGHLRKKRKKATYLPTYLFLRNFEIFRSDFRKYVFGVFELLMRNND
jgi:hypothetical protein